MADSETRPKPAMETSLPVYVTLMTLTFLSVASFTVGLGRLMAVVVALAIASVKATLIGLYYMRLKDESPLIFGIVFVAIAAVLILGFGLLPDLTLK